MSEVTKHVRFDEPIPENQKISFEVGGEVFTTYKSTLRQFPLTLLGNEERLSSFYDEKRILGFREFDKNKKAIKYNFNLNILVSKKLQCKFIGLCRLADKSPKLYVTYIKYSDYFGVEIG
mgnify:CR=1 FL=1